MKKFKSLFCLSFVLVMMFFVFSLSKGNVAVNANSIDYDIVEEGEGSNDNEYFDGLSDEETISETHQIGNGSVGGDDPDPNANTALGIGNGSVGGDDPDPNANTALGIGNGSVGGDDPDPNANTALGIGNGSVGGDDPDPNANTALGIGNGSVGGDDPDPNANTALGEIENVNLNK